MTQNDSFQWIPFGAAKFKRYGSIYFQLIANEPKLQISLVVSGKNLASQKY